jgi:S1-C subfamily serine protease
MNQRLFLASLLVGLLLACPLRSTAGLAEEKAPPKKGFVGLQLAKGEQGIEVTAVIPEGPADKAGLRTGDEILKIAGARTTELQVTVKVVQALKPKSKVKFVILRDGKEKEIEVVVGTLD